MREIRNILAVTNKAIASYEQTIKELEQMEFDVKDLDAAAQILEKDIELFEECRILLQNLAEVTRKQIASELENVVTLCLQAVFDDTISFEIDIDTSHNNTIIEFYVVDTSGDEPVRLPPEDSMGGGIVDTCAIGLRFGILRILDPAPLGPIILDEPAKMVSGDRVEQIGSLIQELTKMFDKQTLLVTHHTSLMDVMDDSLYFEKVKGYTQIGDGK